MPVAPGRPPGILYGVLYLSWQVLPHGAQCALGNTLLLRCPARLGPLLPFTGVSPVGMGLGFLNLGHVAPHLLQTFSVSALWQ